jgi:methylmalonyl-CoA/ethylmalonyl-CoA epimerase
MTEIPQVLQDYILGPAHVGFVVDDLATAMTQAKSLYGLADTDISYQPDPGQDAPTRFAFFAVGGLQFEYIQPCDEYFRQLLLAAPSGGGGINHVAWRVSDIQTAVALLASRGIVPGYVTPGGIIRIGEKQMVYLDPDTTGGQLVELIEESASRGN